VAIAELLLVPGTTRQREQASCAGRDPHKSGQQQESLPTI